MMPRKQGDNLLLFKTFEFVCHSGLCSSTRTQILMGYSHWQAVNRRGCVFYSQNVRVGALGFNSTYAVSLWCPPTIMTIENPTVIMTAGLWNRSLGWILRKVTSGIPKIFQKSRSHPPDCKRQKDEKAQILYWGSANLRCHYTKFNRPSDLATGICVSLSYSLRVCIRGLLMPRWTYGCFPVVSRPMSRKVKVECHVFWTLAVDGGWEYFQVNAALFTAEIETPCPAYNQWFC